MMACLRQVIGPFPHDGQYLIALESGCKILCVPAEPSTAHACEAFRRGASAKRNSFSMMADIMCICAMEVVSSKIARQDGMTYSIIMLASPRGEMKMCFDDPSMSVAVSLYHGVPLEIEADLPDCGARFHHLAAKVPSLCPLVVPPSTDDMRAVCDFWDAAMAVETR